jgi:hypothetical protein
MDDEATARSDQAPSDPRLQEEVTELQGRWEALGEELEAERRKFRLAEATVELLERQDEEAALRDKEGAAGAGVLQSEDDEDASQAAQVSVGCELSTTEAPASSETQYRHLGQATADSSASDKRPISAARGDRKDGSPRTSLVTTLPLSVWREHLTPVLTVREAARLRVVCMALKVLVRAWPMNLGGIALDEWHAEGWLTPENLEAALTCFPSTESLSIKLNDTPSPVEETRMVMLLKKHSGTLKCVLASGEGAARLLLSAVRAGALSNLTTINSPFKHSIDPYILAGGMLRLLEEVHLTVNYDDKAQLAELDHLRHMKHLRCLRLRYTGPWGQEADSPGPGCLPLVPPSLKTLDLCISCSVARPESLMRELPSMLQASGASLEVFGIDTSTKLSAEDGAVLAQVLRALSPTLKTVKLEEAKAYSACTRELLPGLMSCCDTLKVPHCPWAVFSALPATCPSFPCLIELQIEGDDREVIDLRSPAWDIMANGRLPALTSLAVNAFYALSLTGLEGERASEGGGRLANAFEGVAGTLRRLSLFSADGLKYDNKPAGCYELGVAIGKLRHLRDLYLELLREGPECHAVGRGMAASGGCPELFRVQVDGFCATHWLTYEPSLIVPSVRDLSVYGISDIGIDEDDLLLLCCGLVQMGYKDFVRMDFLGGDDTFMTPYSKACLRAILCACGVNACLC